jgi:hypothetical protein
VAYVNPNFKTKTDLKKAVKDGKLVEVYSPGPYPAESNGVTSVEGPHYPHPHTWYARVEVRGGYVVKVIS